MSFVFDVAARAYSERIRPGIADEEVAVRFGLLLEAMHEANHRLHDAVNHDVGVRQQALALDRRMAALAKAPPPACPHCRGRLNWAGQETCPACRRKTP